jgi:SAM-dependent methyltransferase
MTETATLHQDQIDYWNGTGGAKWVEQQERTDRMLAPVADRLIPHAKVSAGDVIIDIGCGCGVTTLTLSELAGPDGRVTALDVSAPMLDVARRRLAGRPNARCVLADAQTHAFPAGSADLLMSRFGVMFFGDPTVAFANMRHALKPGGRIVFACWRPIAENPWMQVPLQAAYQHVPRMPKLSPDDPGPFSFADPERVTRILTGAGFAAPRFTSCDLMLDLAAGGGLDEAVNQACEIGATSRAIQGQPDELVAAARVSIREALAPYATSNGVALGGAIWLVDAVSP